jgi:beta-galactosidase
LMVEGNANLVRWMHVSPSKQDVESCDRVGLMQSLPAGDSEKDVTGRRWEQRVELMRDAIVCNRNNPSIIFYEAGNAQISEAHMAEMIKVRDELDPHGGRAMGCRNMLGSKTAEWGGDMLYVNKSAGKPLWATEFSRDEGLRKYWDELSPPFHKEGDGPKGEKEPPAAYNHNQDAHAIEDVHRWFDYYEQRPGTGERVNAGGVNIIFSDSNTHFRGAENYRRSGEVDAMRLPKDGYFADQVMWDGWVEPEHPRAHIIGHWTYKAGTTKDVYVVSSADKLELLLNGKSVGSGERSSGFLFTFKNVAWQAGTLEATGFDAGGKQVCSDMRKTVGEPSSIKLTPHVGPGGLRADGADLALVDIEVIDADGNRCPTALNPIHFKLTGPAEWRGGLAQARDNGILATTLPVECGVNRVSIRSMPKAGTIELTATADGLRAAKLTLASRPIEVTGGLVRLVSQDQTQPSVTRGPTPTPQPLTPTRTTLHPDRIVAGANGSDVGKLTDDDETTAWSNDGKASTAWLRLEFDRPTTVNQLVMRLGSWRTKSYPLRVIADDGKVVFDGVAPRTVGYSTLAFGPVTCRALRLELTGAAQQTVGQDLVEVTGKTDPNGGANRGGKSMLSIHELEVYGPAEPQQAAR